MHNYIQKCVPIYTHTQTCTYLYIYIGTLHKIFALMTFSIKNYLLFFLSYSIATSISKGSSAGASVHAVVFLFYFSISPAFQESSESISFIFSYNILIVKWWETNFTILLFNDTYRIKIIFYRSTVENKGELYVFA